MPHAAAILVRAPGEFPLPVVRYGTWRQDVDIDKAAKGKRTCRNLVGLGHARCGTRKGR